MPQHLVEDRLAQHRAAVGIRGGDVGDELEIGRPARRARRPSMCVPAGSGLCVCQYAVPAPAASERRPAQHATRRRARVSLRFRRARLASAVRLRRQRDRGDSRCAACRSPGARAAPAGPAPCRARRTACPARSGSCACAGTPGGAAISTPSATTSMPRLRPMSMMVRTMVASPASSLTSRTKDWSIFSVPIGNCCKRRERGVARAEVVDRQVQAHRIQLIEQPHGALGIRHQRGLGDLELEGGGRDAVAAEHRAAAQDEARLAQLLERQVERDAARDRRLRSACWR